jgi:hypothetical protein
MNPESKAEYLLTSSHRQVSIKHETAKCASQQQHSASAKELHSNRKITLNMKSIHITKRSYAEYVPA